jgi:hypothetical protein
MTLPAASIIVTIEAAEKRKHYHIYIYRILNGAIVTTTAQDCYLLFIRIFSKNFVICIFYFWQIS